MDLNITMQIKIKNHCKQVIKIKVNKYKIYKTQIWILVFQVYLLILQ